MATTKYLDYAGLQRYHGKLKTDVITPINNRIDEIVNVGGQPNVIEAVKINNNTFAIADKTASLAMNLTYDSSAKKIKLAIGSETQEIDATDFIKDGMLDNATYSAENKKLTLTFNTASGKSAIDVDLTDLVDTYALSAGAATTGSYLKLTPGVSGDGSTSNPWKVTVALDETNLTTELTNIKADYINHISNSTEGGPEEAFAIYYRKHRADMPDSVTPVPISGLTTGLTKADTATYETLTRANTGNTFTKVMQKFLANDIDLNTRLASVEGTVGGLGSAATKDESYFAKAAHTHDVDDVTTSVNIAATATESTTNTVVTTIDANTHLSESLGILLNNDDVLNTKVTALETTANGLGSAATKDESYFAKAAHTHTMADIRNTGMGESLDVIPDGSISYKISETSSLTDGLRQLLTNDSLLNTRLTTVEGAVADITSISNTEIDALFA